MKISNLSEGMVLKNYKELCNVLEMTPAGGNKKKIQLENLKLHCNYHKEGHKIIIDEIFENSKIKIDKRTLGTNVKYADDIEYLILVLLNKFKIDKDERIGFSKNFLYAHVGFINSNYKIAKGNTLKFSQLIDLPVQTINECFDYTNNRMLKALQTTLNRMQRQSIITYANGYNMVMTDEEGNQFLKVASNEDEKHIMSIERDVLNELGTTNKRLVFISGQWDRFKSLVNKRLKFIYPDLSYYYDNISFNYNYNNIKSILENYDCKKTEIKATVNNKFSKSLDGTIDRRHKKAVDNPDGTLMNNYRRSNNYKHEQKKIKNVLVKDNSDDIVLPKKDSAKIQSLQMSFFDKYSNTLEEVPF